MPILQYNITDRQTPIVIMVGPASCGKSMVLVRIAKYLSDKGYAVKADTAYINTPKYITDCEEFEKHLQSDIAMPGSVTDLLVEVRDPNGNKVCQFLEAPGEDYFSSLNPQKEVPPYLQNICSANVPNRKCFVFLLDLDSYPVDEKGVVHKELRFRNNKSIRDDYTKRLLEIILPLSRKKTDRFVLLYNKIDLTDYGDKNQCENVKGATQDAKNNYGRLFSDKKMKREYLGGFITLNNYKFLPFCTGSFTNETDDEGHTIQRYIISDPIYPQQLWAELMRRF